MLKNVELRKLPAGFLYGMVDILETNNDWKRVMSIIPRNLESDKFEPKYNNEHIRLIEEHAKATGRKCTEILFEEWGTSGRVRPTLETLQQVVIAAQIYRAADVVALMLDEMPPQRPGNGPAALIDTGITKLLENESTAQLSTEAKSIYDKTTKRLTKGTAEVEKAFGNCTTAQMKSATNLIKFSSVVNTEDIPNISALQTVSNYATRQLLKSQDLIEFSTQRIPERACTELHTESANIPNLSAIMCETNDRVTQGTVSTMPSRTQTDLDSSSESMFPQFEREQSLQAVQSSNGYQTSLPNIEFNSNSGIDTSILQDANLIHFDYGELEQITNSFSEDLKQNKDGLSGRIGSGGFGEVFVGIHKKYGPLAVKKAYNHFHYDHKPDIAMKVFNAEVKYLSQFRHENIVPILGFTINGPAMCIVCEYIEGGSLEEKLSENILTARQRMNIMIGTAEGLKYLHGSGNPKQDCNDIKEPVSPNLKKNNFVHGDVKSANILLTRDCVPKLCDFGLAKQLEKTYIVTEPIGTKAYMAPEGFHGTITQKIDIYSYGIVLLELLTGLKPTVVNSNERINIRVFIEENCVDGDITKLLQPADWQQGNEIYVLSRKCLNEDRKSRPAIEEICYSLYQICDNGVKGQVI